jgi:hypothetical protein
MTISAVPRVLVLLAGTASVATPPEPPAPPGYNVHLVQSTPAGRFWRGAAPRADTVVALAASAREHGVGLTLVDLRTPPRADDRSGKERKLTPAGEAALARKLGAVYLPISAMDRQFIPRLQAALKKGDVYLHCMYGVNRTGFAVARYARATGASLDRTGLGSRDWSQGTAFQTRLSGRRHQSAGSRRRRGPAYGTAS